MTELHVYTDDGQPLSLEDDVTRIATELAQFGVTLEQWTAAESLSADAGQEEVIAAYREEIDRLCADGAYKVVDVVRMRPDPDNPDWRASVEPARAKFLSEHRHAEDEVRFFVEGRGCFYLHFGDKVYAVICGAGDLLGVPAGTAHWFDMGTEPEFCAIRFFEEEDGWIGDFTGSDVATRIPYLDKLLATSR
jgi:1,2-dihydroxy-3-keto-5-methylthiopentene dioxygenase